MSKKTVHTVMCAGDWCHETSVRVDLSGAPAEQVAREHRASLAEDGWQDIEGRDYCPDEEV